MTEEQLHAELYRAMKLTKRSEVIDVCHALLAVDDVLIDHVQLGGWLGGTGAPPAYETAACRNGLLHLPSGRLDPPTPRYFATSVPYGTRRTTSSLRR